MGLTKIETVNDFSRPLSRLPDQRHMPVMERTHGRNERNAGFPGTKAVEARRRAGTVRTTMGLRDIATWRGWRLAGRRPCLQVAENADHIKGGLTGPNSGRRELARIRDKKNEPTRDLRYT